MKTKISDGNVIEVDEDIYYKFLLGKVARVQKNGYVGVRGVGILARKILGITDSSILVDHIDRNPLNNVRSNLRVATRSTNGMNREKQINNTSGYKGVSYDRSRGHWIAQIKSGDKHLFLGRFDSPEDAAKAYDSGARKLHGEFAVLNFPNVYKTPTGKRRLSSLSTTGYKGVSKTRSGRYSARCRVAKFAKFLGMFDTAREAGMVYDEYMKSVGLIEYMNGKLLA